jgi:predicted CXXCH cytochrome family protein
MMRKVVLLYISLLLPVLTTSIAYGAFEAPKNPNSGKGCAICHYRWIDTFFEYKKGSDLVKYESEKVVALVEMCFSCHDGSVVDSRARAANDHMHKIDVPPPSHMNIPEVFPLDDKGNMTCSTCHTAHGVPSGEGVKGTIFIRTSNANSNMCRMCHPDMDGGKKEGHHPVDNNMDEIPGALIAKGAAGGEEKGQVICETCHIAHGSPYKGFLVDNGGDSSLCIGCHEDKDSFTPDGKRRQSHLIGASPSKVKIPKELIEKGAKLGDNNVVCCLTCHKVHKNNIEEQLLVIKKKPGSGLCLTCHKDKVSVRNTKHNLDKSAPKEKNLQGYTVAQAGVCSACHLPHMDARKLDQKGDITTRICLSCHGKGKLHEKDYLLGDSHPVGVDPFEKQDAKNVLNTVSITKKRLTLPLYNIFGVQDKNGVMTCATCHNPHKVRVDKKNRKKEIGAKKGTTTSFLRKQSPAICKECHLDKFYIANSKHDMQKVAPKTKNILKQTPSESGLCGSCHLVHNGQKAFMWARDINIKSKYVAETVCISCHNEKGMAGKKTIKDYSHPVNISPLKKGLTTTLPLYDNDGKRSEKGDMACPTCHDPHRWDPLQVDGGPDGYDVEGNSKNSFLRLQNSPSPKLCVNCHADKAYIEKTGHDLMVSAPSSKNIIGQTPEESGVCNACHLVHNSKNWAWLWAQDFGQGESLVEMMCNYCHSGKGPAKKKIPQVVSHPVEQKISNLGRDDKTRINYFPLFSRNFGELVSRAKFSCPSCHDVHRWGNTVQTKGKGVAAYGDATTSFLRAKSSIMICRDCHGEDSLFKYKYYHKADVRKK